MLECIFERHIRQRVELDEMQCRFMSGHGGTTVAVFILSQLQKLLLTSNKPFYVTFINILKGQQVGSVHALNQQVVGGIDELHDHGLEKQDNGWQLSQ